jgi:hypothetical protein
MELLNVTSAEATADPDVIIAQIVADVGLGIGPEPLSFTVRKSDPFGLGPAVREWLAANPDFPVAPYVAPPPEQEPVPEEISDRQFFQQLAIAGLITQDEALAAVMTGALPAAMLTFVASLPADQQFAARMALCGATVFKRSHPLTAAFASAEGMTPEQIDALWRAAAALV